MHIQREATRVIFLRENKGFSLLHETISFAAVAELADAQDLKSCVLRTCGFKSHQPYYSLSRDSCAVPISDGSRFKSELNLTKHKLDEDLLYSLSNLTHGGLQFRERTASPSFETEFSRSSVRCN